MAEITGTSKAFTDILKRIYRKAPSQEVVDQTNRAPLSRKPTTLREAQKADQGADLRVKTAYRTAKGQRDLKNRYLAGD